MNRREKSERRVKGIEIAKKEITRRKERQIKYQVERMNGFSRTVCCWGNREAPRKGGVQADEFGAIIHHSPSPGNRRYNSRVQAKVEAERGNHLDSRVKEDWRPGDQLDHRSSFVPCP